MLDAKKFSSLICTTLHDCGLLKLSYQLNTDSITEPKKVSLNNKLSAGDGDLNYVTNKDEFEES